MLPGADLWEWIRLPFHNPHHIFGTPSRFEFNPSNNVIRFLVFVTLPSMTWFALGRWSKPIAKRRDRRPLPAREVRLAERALTALAAIGLILAFAFFLGQFADRFGDHHLDFYHDGDFLAPAWKWVATGKLWSTSYLTRGAVNDVLAPWFAWLLLGQRTIGAFKAFDLFLITSVPLALLTLILIVQHSMRREVSPVDRALLLATMLSVLFLGMLGPVQFLSRSWPVLLSLIGLISAFERKSKPLFFCAGALATLALFTSTEVGIYVAIAEAVTLAFFVQDPKEDVFPWAGGLATGHLAVFAAFGPGEYLPWLRQIVDSATRWEFVYSEIYPGPLTAEAWQIHSWPLILFALLVLGFCYLAPTYRAKTTQQGRIHLLLLSMSLISYRTALGRCDSHHVKIGLGFACLSTGFSLWLLLREVPPKAWRFTLGLASSPLLYLLLFSHFRASRSFPSGIEAASRVGPYVSEPDSRFLQQDEAVVLKELQRTMSDGDCAFTFVNEPLWYYLLRKRPCGRFHFTVHAMGDDFESEITRDLGVSKPEYMLYSSPRDAYKVDGFPNSVRLPLLSAWIDEHYVPYSSVAGWEIRRLRR
jgi:hypothetical protein